MSLQPILELSNISKSFGPVTALQDVSFKIKSGEILAILGENGAGKSTLMKIISGLYRPDAGDIKVNNNWFLNGKVKESTTLKAFSDPKEAINLGIGMIYQHFQLVEPFTVAENIVLGNEIVGKYGFIINKKRTTKHITELSKKYGLAVDSDKLVEELPVGIKQKVEILKQLYRNAKLLIYDEPTAVLTPSEVEDLFKTMNSLKASGKSQIFISHKLHEPLKIADRIIILQGGKIVKKVGPEDIAKTSVEDLAYALVGRKLRNRLERMKHDSSETILKVKNLTMYDKASKIEVLRNLSFSVNSGEVVGVAGVEGNGQTELTEAIFGLKKVSTDTSIEFYNNKTIYLNELSTLEILRSKISFIPEDRNKQGLISEFSMKENCWLAFHGNEEQARKYTNETNNVGRNRNIEKLNRWFFIPHKLSLLLAQKIKQRFKVVTPDINEPVKNLSGGNQQKVILGREFAKEPRLIVAAQPTRGVDIGVMEQVHSELIKLRNNGAGILLISADLDEILKLSDRILVIYEGKIIADRQMQDYTMKQLSTLMLGGTSETKRRS